MTHRLALLVSLMFVAAAPCGAQSPASDTTTPAPKDTSATSPAPASSTTTTSATAPAATPAVSGSDSSATASKAAASATDASAEPSPELIKQARLEGFRPKKRNGVTMFCQKSAAMNTHFETETCVDEAHLKMLAEQREDQRNQMRQSSACTGSSCNGH